MCVYTILYSVCMAVIVRKLLVPLSSKITVATVCEISIYMYACHGCMHHAQMCSSMKCSVFVVRAWN